MSFLEKINHIVGRRTATVRPAGADCPHVSDVLAYMERTLTADRREELEGHFADCNACCESLALFTQINNVQGESQGLPFDEPSASEVQNQTARVLALIEKHDRKSVPPKRKAAGAGFYLSYRQVRYAALIICAATAACIFWTINRPSPSEQAMGSLATALEGERRIEARLSGGLPYSPYYPTRNEFDADDLKFNMALNKVRFAEQGKASTSDRLVLARTLLARDRDDDANRGRAILESLAGEGHASPEVHNDLGVAYLELKDYDRAIASFDKALETRPGFPEALFNRALARKALAKERAGYRDQALKDLDLFIESSSDEQWRNEARQYLDKLKRLPAR